MDLDRQSELNALRPDLLRFARLQLRDAGAAEDAVQETLLAALTGSHRFESRSSYKTWLISILRNKIIDTIRSQSREVSASSLADDEAGDRIARHPAGQEPRGHRAREHELADRGRVERERASQQGCGQQVHGVTPRAGRAA